jgi:hypothetical protein
MHITRSESPHAEYTTHGPTAREALAARYRDVRGRTEALCAPLAPDDYGLQAMPDASPAKWHLAHTS